VFENRALGRIFGPREEEGTGARENCIVFITYAVYQVVRVIKSVRMIRVGL
jgi:hypothetical protein